MEVISDTSTLLIIQAIILIVLLAVFVLPVVCLVSIFRSSLSLQTRLLWVLTVLLVPIVGAMLYLQFGRGRLMEEGDR